MRVSDLAASAGQRVVVVDKAPVAGEAGASFRWKGHTLDFGPMPSIRAAVPPSNWSVTCSPTPNALVEGHKQVHVYLRGKRFKYPLQVGEALLKFNPLLSLIIIIQFVLTSIFHSLVSIPIENFENWGKKRFGPTLYKLSFGDYTEKVWKTSADKISAKFASEKIQGFSFINLVRRLFRIGGQVTEPYYQTWLYHRYGSGQLYLRLAERIRELGGETILSTDICSVNWTNKRVHSVTISNCDGVQEIRCSWIVNTIPLPHLIGLLGDQVPFLVTHSASQLRYISLILVYIEFEVEHISEDHWFYLLDNKFRFNRVTEQKNLSASTMEPGKTVLSFELTCRAGDAVWRLSDDELFELAKKDSANIVNRQIGWTGSRDFQVKHIPNVYEIYFIHFDQHASIFAGVSTPVRQRGEYRATRVVPSGGPAPGCRDGACHCGQPLPAQPDRAEVDDFVALCPLHRWDIDARLTGGTRR